MSQDKEREDFEAHEQQRTGRKPLTWDEAYKPDPVPKHVQGKYLIKADQQAWEAWQARAALASQQAGQGEPVAWVAPCRGYNTVGYHSDKINALTVGTKLYASPPSREPLTELLIEAEFGSDSNESYPDFLAGVRFAERAHGIHSREGGSN